MDTEQMTNLKLAMLNLYIEANNIHLEYLAGQHGGCPCLDKPQHEACPLASALDAAGKAYTSAFFEDIEV